MSHTRLFPQSTDTPSQSPPSTMPNAPSQSAAPPTVPDVPSQSMSLPVPPSQSSRK
jgi:hypothetical protein